MTQTTRFLPDVQFQRESHTHLKVTVALPGRISKDPNQPKNGHLHLTVHALSTTATKVTRHLLCRPKTKTLVIRFVGFGAPVTNSYSLRDWPAKPAKKTPAKK